jgi:beta-galactosidase
MAPVPEQWDRNWHHIAGVCDGSTLKLYVDGELLQVYEISGNIGHTPFCWNIGRNAQCPKGRKTNGYLDEARIYLEALSGEEIRKAMNRQVQNGKEQKYSLRRIY